MGTVATNARIYLDVETTGLSPFDSQIIEVAAVLFADGVPTSRFESLVHASPEAIERGREALAINKVPPALLASAPPADTVAASLKAWLDAIDQLHPEATYHSFNADFDFRFLRVAPWLLDQARVGECVMKASMEHMGWSRWPKLRAAAEFFKLEFEGEAHRAMADTLMAARIYEEIIRARKAVSV